MQKLVQVRHVWNRYDSRSLLQKSMCCGTANANEHGTKKLKGQEETRVLRSTNVSVPHRQEENQQ